MRRENREDPGTQAAQAHKLTACLSPQGHLRLAPSDEAPELEPRLLERLVRAFDRGAGHGLLQLAGRELGQALPPVLAYWRGIARSYVTRVCTRADAAEDRSGVPPPPDPELAKWVAAAPVMPGAEYLTPEVLGVLWGELGVAFTREHAASRMTVQEFVKSLNPAWNVVGRVHFNLAENRKDGEAPFAFLATYTGSVSSDGKVQHLPLGQALRAYAGAANKQQLLSLLVPVQRAAEQCRWLKQMVDAGEIFHPLRWAPEDAYRFLADVSNLEQAGVVVRMPAGWKAGRPPRPQVTATVGGRKPGGVGASALLDFKMEVTLDGQALTPAEIQALLARTGGLAWLRGQWVEVDQEQLAVMMERFHEAERLAASGGLSFIEAMRMLAGAQLTGKDTVTRAEGGWSRVAAGPWLQEVIKGLLSPEGLSTVDPGPDLVGKLRPYQLVGVRWLHLLAQLGLGACLADDMGLGKTIQVLALLLIEKRKASEEKRPSLLVAPASLLSNWAIELARFAPGLKSFVAHPSVLPKDELSDVSAKRLKNVDLVITSYGSLLRFPWLATTSWHLAILDEAQAIKNPGSKQTRAAKSLTAHARIALTGTPIENRLGDLWSIFDFIQPGLLGNAKEFSGYTKRMAEQPNPYGPLRDLLRPYILRRLKTDRRVITDLPDKTELKAFCSLTKKQAALYQQAVEELASELKAVDGIKRRGLVLASLMRMKQICNHPSQWLGDGGWEEDESGKWARLRELGEVILAKQEKALIFTQFREVTAPLSLFLAQVFGRPGLVLHGETEVKKRKDLVKRFQEDESVPFFVLSLKAGGSGLNLTAASHVIHFDRWWNPAVENQASDRAFRIGQTKNVLVHKFVCRGTVEEKIDSLIESKRQLSEELLSGEGELKLTELKDDELLRLVTLDLQAAMKE